MPNSIEQSEARWSEVDEYLSGMLLEADPILEAALQESARAQLPAISVSPNQGKLLMLLARIQGAGMILEIGTLGGYSTIWLGRALPPHGRLLTLELETKHAEVARANLARAGLSSKVEVRVGSAVDSLARILAQREGPFDLIFIDADKEGYPEYLEWSLKLSRPGTIIVADNVVRKGEIIETASQDSRVRGARRFLEMVRAEKRLDATAIQTVGLKGYDGFAIAVVT